MRCIWSHLFRETIKKRDLIKLIGAMGVVIAIIYTVIVLKGLHNIFRFFFFFHS